MVYHAIHQPVNRHENRLRTVIQHNRLHHGICATGENWWLSISRMVFITFSPFLSKHDDVIKWKHCPRYWPFVREIHRSQLNSLHKGQWRGALMFSLICAWINGWVNNHEAGDLRRHRTHYDVIVMSHTCLWVFHLIVCESVNSCTLVPEYIVCETATILSSARWWQSWYIDYLLLVLNEWSRYTL